MDFFTLYGYTDTIISQLFAGVPQKVTWSSEEIEALHLSQIYTLMLTYTMNTRKLAMSRIGRPPYDIIMDKTGYKEIETTMDRPNYVIYSEHDF